MINTREIDIDIEFPATEVGLVLMQPFVSLSAQEPFTWTGTPRATQLQAISQVLALAKAPNHGAPKTHFTLFPEYSICGLDGVRLIQASVSGADWPNGTVVIGGVDGLSSQEIQTLRDEPATDIALDGAAAVPHDKWVNCTVTWVKDSRGNVRRWIQPKIHPAWPENNIAYARMHEGRTVYVFKGRFSNTVPCRFLSLICFDWIGLLGGRRIVDRLMDSLNTAWQGSSNELHWLFVLQHNPSPNHRDFLNNAVDFFNDRAQFPCVEKSHCAVVMANTASSLAPGGDGRGGFSSFLFSPAAQLDNSGCPPTYTVTNKIRKAVLDRVKDAAFRESGSCAHSIRHKVPRFIPGGTPARTQLLEIASVNPLAVGGACPRTPGGEVPAAVKWTGDSLDRIQSLSTRFPEAPLAGELQPKHISNATQIAALNGGTLATRIRLASCRRECARPVNPAPFPVADDWATRETDGLAHVLDVVSMISTSTDIEIQATPGHATLRDRAITVVAVRGDSHEDCRRYFDTIFERLPREGVLLVTRDNDNSPPTLRDRRITEGPERGAGAEPSITDPASGIRHIGFRALHDSFLAAPDIASLRGQVNGFLS